MPNIKHTSGPWNVRATRGEAGKPKTVWVQHGDRGTIAHIHCGIRILEKPAPSKEDIDAIKEANARLIAAAPDLLQFIENWREIICGGDAQTQLEGWARKFNTEALALISKAKN